MKVLKVYYDNGDYGAVSFENVHRGTAVKEIIDNPEKFKPETEEQEEQWTLEVKEFEGEGVDEKFLNFIRNEMIDYDSSKHETFYMENETV